MFNKYNKLIYSFSISVLLHLIILTIALVHFEFTPKVTRLGDTQVKIVSSYLYQNNGLHTQEVKNKVPLKEPKERETRPITKNVPQSISISKAKTKKIEKSNDDSTKKVLSQNSSSSNGQSTQELLALLHAAIQREQHYPPSALQMERHGRVKVGFTLFASGIINNLRIITTSGTESLDIAALSAVKNAAPFAQANQYIKEPQEYSIDVIFELT